MNKKQSYYFGYLMECLVIFLLFLSTYRIIKHRYKSKYGEIDVIAIKKNKILFIEVKGRKSKQLCLEVLSLSQITRIKYTAKYFMMIHGEKYINYHFSFLLYSISPFSISKRFF